MSCMMLFTYKSHKSGERCKDFYYNNELRKHALHYLKIYMVDGARLSRMIIFKRKALPNRIYFPSAIIVLDHPEG